MIWPDPTHQPTYPPTHPPKYTPTHGWGSLHRFQIFKQNQNISISSSAIEFWMIPGVPPLGGGGVGGWGGGWWEGAPHPCAHARTYDIIGNPRDFPKSNGGGHLHEITMFTMQCMRACACVHVHVHVCGGHPPTTPHPHPPTPPPLRATGSRKHQNSITLELIKIIQFCLKILYLWTFLNSYRLQLVTPDTPHPPAPPPRAA